MKLRLFTPCCHHCNKRISDPKDVFCVECNGKLPLTSFYLSDSDNIIKSRFHGLIHIDMAGSYLYYLDNEMVKNILYQIKYQANTDIAVELGRRASRRWDPEIIADIDMIIPMPLHSSKKALRGYNQCDYFAQGINAETHIKLEKNLLERTKATLSQTKLSKKERVDNVMNAFRVRDFDKIKGKHILLVDDVITTGATLEFAAKELQKSRARKISIYTLATAFEL